MPYFAEIAAINGAEVVVVDKFPQAEYHKRLFTEVKADIVEAVADENLANLPGLKNKQFDIIFSANFVGFNSAPNISFIIDSGSFKHSDRGLIEIDLETRLVEQLTPLLAKGGIMDLDLYEDNKLSKLIVYRKADGELVKEVIDVYKRKCF